MSSRSEDSELRDVPAPLAGELREVRATDQAIRQEAPLTRPATEIPAGLTSLAGEPAGGWRGGNDGG
jgi:hypothetical protein